MGERWRRQRQWRLGELHLGEAWWHCTATSARQTSPSGARYRSNRRRPLYARRRANRAVGGRMQRAGALGSTPRPGAAELTPAQHCRSDPSYECLLVFQLALRSGLASTPQPKSGSQPAEQASWKAALATLTELPPPLPAMLFLEIILYDQTSALYFLFN